MDKPHKKLDVWKLSMELSRGIYRLTTGYPSEERFGLVSQMRRAAVSVPSNIAEGAARDSNNVLNKGGRGVKSPLDSGGAGQPPVARDVTAEYRI